MLIELDNPQIERMWKADLYSKAISYKGCAMQAAEMYQLTNLFLKYVQSLMPWSLFKEDVSMKFPNLLEKALKVAAELNSSAAQYKFVHGDSTRNELWTKGFIKSDQRSETMRSSPWFGLTPGLTALADYEGEACKPVIIMPQLVYYADPASDLMPLDNERKQTKKAASEPPEPKDTNRYKGGYASDFHKSYNSVLRGQSEAPGESNSICQISGY